MTLDQIIAPGSKPEIFGSGYEFCEGPAADLQGNVYLSDGPNDSIYFYEVGRPVVLLSDQCTDPNGMIFNTNGELYVCEGAAHRVTALNVQSKQRHVLCQEIDGTHFNEPNDVAVDFEDGFYFSDPNYQHRGQPTVMKQDTYYATAEGKVSRVSTVCFKPNGVLLSADGATLYVADSRGQCIYRYRVRGPGRLAEETKWIDALGANPDGMTLDEHDNLYVCLGRGGVKIFDSQAKLIGHLDVHASNTCFGGADFRTLLITSVDKLLGWHTQVTGIKPRALCRDG